MKLSQDYLHKLEGYFKSEKLSKELYLTLKEWHSSYSAAAQSNGKGQEVYQPILNQFLDLVMTQLANPFHFEPYHEKLVSPLDLHKMSLDFIKPLVKIEESKALHLEYADRIVEQLKLGDNVIFLANHQTELDPQAIGLLLEKSHPKLAEEMIFVAGHRVTSDPLAVPFSKGCNLLCIYSKKYIENDPTQKEARLLHNQRTLKKMGQLLSEGGKCIYVAPSGGRDRKNSKGTVEVAPFDAQSIELFWLTAQKAERSTHFYPLTLATYNLLPPPEGIKKTIGEPRHTKATKIFLSFGPEVDMEHFPGSDVKDKKEKRLVRANYIWEQVKRDYQEICELSETKNVA